MLTESRIIALARKSDCALELFSGKSESKVFSAQKGQVHAKDDVQLKGYAVRTIKGKRLGFYYFEREGELELAVNRSLKLGALQEKGDYYFPSGKGRSKKYFDAKAYEFDDFANHSLRKMIGAHLDAKVKPVQNIIGCAVSEEALLNSEGAGVSQKFSSFFAVSQCGFKQTEADDALFSARFGFSPEKIAKNAAEFARASADAKKIPRGNMKVIFDIRALYHFLQLFLPFHFSGESFRKKLLRHKRGDRIAPENISFYDDPFLADGEKPAEFDDEGFKTRRMALIEKGALKNYLFDMHTAAKMKNEQAGNGLRASAAAPPGISFTNVSVEGGDAKDLVAECKSGVYVNSFLTSGANPVTGDFSFPLLVAFRIKNGEPAHAIRGAMMKGNFFELLKRAEFERETAVYNGLKSGRLSAELEIVS